MWSGTWEIRNFAAPRDLGSNWDLGSLSTMPCCVFTLFVSLSFNWTTKFIQYRMEWIFHFVAMGFALSTAVAGLVLKLYNPNGTFCWIETSPYNCQHMEWRDCTRGLDADTFQWQFAGYPLIAAFVVIFIAMSWICLYLWNRGRIMKTTIWKRKRRIHEIVAQSSHTSVAVRDGLFHHVYLRISSGLLLSGGKGTWLLATRARGIFLATSRVLELFHLYAIAVSSGTQSSSRKISLVGSEGCHG